MTATLITTPLSAIADEATMLLHLHRVNMETADLFLADFGVTDAWNRLVDIDNKEGGRMTRLCDLTNGFERSGGFPHDYKEAHQMYWMTLGTLHRTAVLASLLEHDQCWPRFKTDGDNERINIWLELIASAGEAKRIRDTITDSSRAINTLFHMATTGRSAKELHGWYVSASTHRRHHTGWVVGGRGDTLHILPDPLSLVARHARNTSHQPAITDEVAARHIGNVAWHTETTERVTYSLKRSDIQLVLPPDIAHERKIWMNQVLATAEGRKEDSKSAFEAYAKWSEDTADARRRKGELEVWRSKTDPTPWLREGSSLDRWVFGGVAAMTILLDESGMTPEDLHKKMEASRLAAHPDFAVTEEELEKIDNPPMGATTLAGSLTDVLLTQERGNLVPMF